MRTKMILMVASIFLLASQAMAQGNPPAAPATIPYQPPMPKPSYDCNNSPKVKSVEQEIAAVKQCIDSCDATGGSVWCKTSCISKPSFFYTQKILELKQQCNDPGLTSFNQCWEKTVIDKDRRLCIHDFESKYWN